MDKIYKSDEQRRIEREYQERVKGQNFETKPNMCYCTGFTINPYHKESRYLAYKKRPKAML